MGRPLLSHCDRWHPARMLETFTSGNRAPCGCSTPCSGSGIWTAPLPFYTDVLGMQLLRRKEYPSGRFTLAFLGYGPESEQTVLELTHNWDTSSYELGDAYGHIALGVEDIRSTCAAISGKGGRVVREPGPMKHGSTVIAFVEDPDGYKVELIEMSSRAAA